VENCVFQCLKSPEKHPNELVEDSDVLVRYVSSGENDTDACNYPDRPWYEFSCRKPGTQNIDSPVGRYQVEMLIRTCNQAIDHLSGDWGKAMDQITFCCEYLWRYPHGVFEPVSVDNTQCQSVQVINLCIVNG